MIIFLLISAGKTCGPAGSIRKGSVQREQRLRESEGGFPLVVRERLLNKPRHLLHL